MSVGQKVFLQVPEIYHDSKRRELMTDFCKRSLIIHEQLRGKIAIQSKVSLETRDDLATVYTPGLA